jgi:hypothetical protein
MSPGRHQARKYAPVPPHCPNLAVVLKDSERKGEYFEQGVLIPNSTHQPLDPPVLVVVVAGLEVVVVLEPEPEPTPLTAPPLPESSWKRPTVT